MYLSQISTNVSRSNSSQRLRSRGRRSVLSSKSGSYQGKSSHARTRNTVSSSIRGFYVQTSATLRYRIVTVVQHENSEQQRRARNGFNRVDVGRYIVPRAQRLESRGLRSVISSKSGSNQRRRSRSRKRHIRLVVRKRSSLCNLGIIDQ